jgi:hypothetical protein
MSTARITIGGLDVSPHPGDSAAGALPGAESQITAGVARARSQDDSGHAPVILTMEPTRRLRCPIPAGPWRIISALAVLGLILSSVAVLRERQRRIG